MWMRHLNWALLRGRRFWLVATTHIIFGSDNADLMGQNRYGFRIGA
jgi:hypothetical protein